MKLYKLSDYIGCMSPANVKYLLDNNPYINKECVEVAPNSVIPQDCTFESKDKIRQKYGLPLDKTIFIYGGNLGKPQGIDFLINCLKKVSNRKDCHFLIIGSGVEYPKLSKWFTDNTPHNATLMQGLPVNEYNQLVQSCDVGMIFLDYRFTIPNFPARLLSYLEFHMPVLAATDCNTDVGTIAVENGFGLWCPSNDVDKFEENVDKFLKSNLKIIGDKAYDYFIHHYTVSHTYNVIFNHFR